MKINSEEYDNARLKYELESAMEQLEVLEVIEIFREFIEDLGYSIKIKLKG